MGWIGKKYSGIHAVGVVVNVTVWVGGTGVFVDVGISVEVLVTEAVEVGNNGRDSVDCAGRTVWVVPVEIWGVATLIHPAIKSIRKTNTTTIKKARINATIQLLQLLI